MEENKKPKINTFVRDKEVTLSNELINKIYEEVLVQFESQLDLTKIDFEIVIEVVNEVEEDQDIEIELTDFNQNLKKALNFNPKKSK